MQTPDLVTVIRALGWAIGIGGVVLVAWSLIWDRSRRLRRCPRCWYNMQATPSLRCPECGREAKSERSLHRRKRRWRGVLLGVVALPMAYATWASPRCTTGGWLGLVPTSGLIWWVGRHEPPETYRNGRMSAPTRWGRELGERFARAELWDWEWRWLLRELGAVRGNPRWPGGETYLVSTGVPRWLESPGALFAFTSELPEAGQPMGSHLFAWNAGRLAPFDTSVAISVSAGAYEMRWILPVKQVERAEDVFELVSDPPLDEAVRRAFRASVRRDNNPITNTGYTLGVRLYRDTGPVPADLTLGVMVEFLRDGKLMGEFPLCPLESPFGEPTDWIRINAPDPGWDESDASDMARWTVRLRGDPRTALRDAGRRRCWTGAYTMPLSDFLMK